MIFANNFAMLQDLNKREPIKMIAILKKKKIKS